MCGRIDVVCAFATCSLPFFLSELITIKPKKKSGLWAAQHRATLSLWLNFFLAVAKCLVGAAANSPALISDAIHSAVDILASGAAYIGRRVADRQHPSFPYGFYKAETLATFLTSMAILLAACKIGKDAIFDSNRIPDVSLALPVVAGSLAITWLFGFFQLHAGRRLSSPVLISDAKDYLVNSLSTWVVLVSLIGASYGYALDRWASAIVSIFIFRSGGQLLLTTLKDLLDASIDRETEQAIIKLVESYPRVSRVERCFSRTVGSRFIIDLDVIFWTQSHEVADWVSGHLEEYILKDFPKVVMARVRPRSHNGILASNRS